MCQAFETQEFEVLEFMLPRLRSRLARPSPGSSTRSTSRPPPPLRSARGHPGLGARATKFVPPLLAALDPAVLPEYRHIGQLDRVDQLMPNQGLYLLEFTIDGERRGYSGMSTNLTRRLMAHRLCARVMGINVNKIEVYVATGPANVAWRDKEKALHLLMRDKARNVLTNQRLELELELDG
ncbi:hypothetical protein FHW58_001522 [Duganella sp. 1224]|uniref:hypothetical protein n=1 Tax=Duganella sp. 1224 TaxID=2587052 RepID=UPI0015CB9292|nr:hypothetical protein [Duganella sp. 1224]NYE60370.1 hypothetical protein [Duganella sp. 1224]